MDAFWKKRNFNFCNLRLRTVQPIVAVWRPTGSAPPPSGVIPDPREGGADVRLALPRWGDVRDQERAPSGPWRRHLEGDDGEGRPPKSRTRVPVYPEDQEGESPSGPQRGGRRFGVKKGARPGGWGELLQALHPLWWGEDCSHPDRKDACWRCGATGYGARDCKAPPRGLTCLDRSERRRLLPSVWGRASEIERRELKFLQLNLGRGKGAQDLLIQTARERGTDVLLISE